MKLRAVLLVAVCTAALAAPVQAQDVRVSFANGRVTVIAENATLADILREWQRVGGSTFINLEKISSSEPLTLRLENAPELEAIDVLLRSTAGYVVAGRSAASTSPSAIGRVLLMAGNRPLTYPAPTASAPPAAVVSNDDGRMRMSAGPPRPDDDGPVRQQMMASPPPPAAAQPAPLGQASPLQNTTTQTNPVLGTITSPQPGATIGSQPSRPGGRLIPTPTQPRPGGGGG